MLATLSTTQTLTGLLGLVFCALILWALTRSTRRTRHSDRLGRAYSEPEPAPFHGILGLACLVIGGHALLILAYLIICAVFGAQEPRW